MLIIGASPSRDLVLIRRSSRVQVVKLMPHKQGEH
jgi:hypothetical protein